MPPAKKTAPADPPEQDVDTTDDTATEVDTSGLSFGDYVRYEREDGSIGHGVVLEAIAGDTDREDSVAVIPWPEPVTVSGSQLVDDED